MKSEARSPMSESRQKPEHHIRLKTAWHGALGILLGMVSVFGFQCPAFPQDLPAGFIAETVAKGINAATAITIAPDGRVFLAEQTGALRVFKNDHVLPEPALDLGERLDIYWERGLIGVTLHPDFPRTPHVFVVYVANEPFTHHVVSRFTVAGDQVDPASEMVLLRGDDQSKLGGFQPAGHQGGPIRVGPDGKLYVGLGEQTAGQPSQALDTLQGKILRLNVDGSIPQDNPFYTKTTGNHRSIWARGIRNPFGLTFEPGTGRLWETDVGQTSFEEVNIITKGGNYGWPDAEGMSTNTAFVNPVHAYRPTIGRCIVGAMFYPSSIVGDEVTRLTSTNGTSEPPYVGAYLFPEKWRGKFFFADWANHWIKALDPNSPSNVLNFVGNLNGPVALEPAPDGSIYVLNRGTVWRDPNKFEANTGSLVRIRHVGDAATITETDAEPIPADLNATGLFKSLAPLTTSANLVPFELNSPPWQPGVKVRRWISVPDGKSIMFREDNEWEFPEGTVVIQHFSLDGGSQDGDAFETQIMWFNGPRTVQAGAYRWGASGSSASLIEDGEFTSLPGQEGRNWFTPGAEHHLNLDQVVTGFVLPLNTGQANRDGQLEAWNELGWFAPALTNLDQLPKLASLADSSATVELHVRSFMDANCAMCHRPGGISRGVFDARFRTPLNEQGLINGRLAAGDLGIAGAKVVVPGHPDQSILLQRVSRTDFFRMPPIAFSDDRSPLVSLLEKWIQSMPESEQANK